jgi:peptidoglycan biosynthesis protein MviN/MurJ (putative lipid II flippase)
MTPTIPSASEQAWAMIEQEKRRDRFLRRVSFAAWTMTFLLVVFLAVISIWQMIEMMKMFDGMAAGLFPTSAFFGAMYPLLIVLGVLSVLIATLSTVGMFLRQRTASLAEIQLRLAALEELLTRKAQE